MSDLEPSTNDRRLAPELPGDEDEQTLAIGLIFLAILLGSLFLLSRCGTESLDGVIPDLDDGAAAADTELTLVERTENRLDDDGYRDADGFEVDVTEDESSIITLTGEVPSAADKAAAEASAREVDGVDDVVNNLVVAEPAPTTTEAPAPTTTEAPAPTTTEAPAPTTTEAPAPTTTVDAAAANQTLEDDLNAFFADAPVLFESGSAVLVPEATAILDQVVARLEEAGDTPIVISGFTDSQGPDDANTALSLDRANAVRDYLTSQGIAEGRLSALGLGETDQFGDNSTPEGRQQNRRIVFNVNTASG